MTGWTPSRRNPFAMDYIPSFLDRLFFFLEPVVWGSTLVCAALALIAFYFLRSALVVILPMAIVEWWVIFFIYICISDR